MNPKHIRNLLLDYPNPKIITIDRKMYENHNRSNTI